MRCHLNVWGQKAHRWRPMDAWKRCSGPPRRLVDWECWIGLDLSKTTDLTAMVCAFPNEDGSIDLLPFFWLPEARIHYIEKRVHADLQGWIRRDLLETTPGNVHSLFNIMDTS